MSRKVIDFLEAFSYDCQSVGDSNLMSELRETTWSHPLKNRLN